MTETAALIQLVTSGSPETSWEDMHMKTGVGAAVFAVSLAYGVVPASAYTQLFAFGDSLSDAGNHFQATGSPQRPYVMGHASNGPTWVEDLSLQLNLSPLTPSLLGGNDFAFAGAQSGQTDANPNLFHGTAAPNPTREFDLDAQVTAYQTAHPNPVPGALYTLDIGANDISGALATFPTNPAEITSILSQAVANTITAVTDLYNDGARDLLFYEVPDAGLAAFLRDSASKPSERHALTFDQAMLAALGALNAPGLKIFDLQTFSLLDEVVGNPTAFGFNPTTIHESCFDTSALTLCSTLPAVQNSYFFWDGLHPTEAGHLIAADRAFGLVAPEPSTWGMMLVGFIGLGLIGFRERTRRTAPARAVRSYPKSHQERTGTNNQRLTGFP
jgi:phospholipase/lecithinase/hemolysin